MIEQEVITKLRQGNLLNLELPENQDRFICEFSFIQEVIEGQYRHKCKKCNYDFCIFGCEDNHIGYTCQQYKTFESLRTKDHRDEIEALGLKFCPSCDVITERLSGCNHIECTNCGIHYCFICYFKNEDQDLIYQHLDEIHGGYFDENDDDVNEEEQYEEEEEH